MKPLIVHVSADFPDAWEPRKTRAIAALIEGTRDRFDHRVYSLNRDGSGLRAVFSVGTVTEVADAEGIASWRYAAPSKGVFLARSMTRVAQSILRDIHDQRLRVAMVHGHKLSFEGIAASVVARELGVPYALTLQGNTDQKVVAARCDLRASYRSVWHGAAIVFAFAPWIADWCERELGARGRSDVALPCVPVADAIIPPRPTGTRIVTAFHLDQWRNKNIETLARACASLLQRFPDLTLEIAGAGNPEDERAVDTILDREGASGFGRRIGAVEGDSIQTWMNGAAVLALPSKRESFGMVFVEALLAGCPIVYPRGAAVDGYFNGVSFAAPVDAKKVEDVAEGIGRLLQDNASCKAELSNWQRSGAGQFRRDAILGRYADAMAALAG